MKPKEITICGKTYASITEAAKENGIWLPTLMHRIKMGMKDEDLIRDNRLKPTVAGGVMYPSRRDAAQAYGITKELMYARIQYDWTDEDFKRGFKKGSGVKKPITIDGVTYPSRKAAIKALSISKQTLYNRYPEEVKV